MKKEINSSIPHWHPSCIAYHMIITISDSPIHLHFSNQRVIAIPDSSISINLSHHRVTLRQTGAHITSKHQSVTPQKFSLVDVHCEK